MKYRVLETKAMPPLECRCSLCDATMQSTGQLFHDGLRWAVVFRCPVENDFVPVTGESYEPMIEVLTRGIDPTTLPFFGGRG